MSSKSLAEYLFCLRNEVNKGIKIIYNNENEEFIPYKKLYELSKEFSEKIKLLGVKEKQYLVLQLENEKNYLISFWGCILSNVIPMPMKLAQSTENMQLINNILNAGDDIRIILEKEQYKEKEYFHNIEKSILFYEDIHSVDCKVNYDEISKIDEKNTALIQFSSGSTGNPKGIIVSHGNILSEVSSLKKSFDLKDNSSISSWVPLTHNFGLIDAHILCVVNNLNEQIIPTKTFINTPEVWLKNVSDNRTTHLLAPNFGLRYVAENIDSFNYEDVDLSCVKAVISASENITESTCDMFLSKLEKYKLDGNALSPAYGLAESTAILSMAKAGSGYKKHYVNRNKLSVGDEIEILDKENDQAVSFVEDGQAIDCCKVRICDNENNILPEKHIGNIQVKGDIVTLGYLNDKGNESSDYKDGWLNTGDVGFLDKDGLTVTARSKEIIIINGKNLYPSDFETIIEKDEKIASGNVVAAGCYNDLLEKDEILVFLQLNKDNENAKDIAGSIKRNIKRTTGFDIKEVICIDSIPKNDNGKVQRLKLIKMYKAGAFDQNIRKMNESKNNKKEKLKVKSEFANKFISIVRDELDNNEIEITDLIYEYNISSMKIIKIISMISRKFNVRIEFKEFIESDTFLDLSNKISDKYYESKENKNIYENFKIDKEHQYDDFDLTNVQMAYLMGRSNQFELGGVATHLYTELNCSIDIKKFNDSLQKVIERQPMLRAVTLANGKQKVLENVPYYKIKVIDSKDLTEEEKNKIILEEREKLSHHVFETTNWPLFEFKALKMEDNNYRLFFGIDLLIADGLSIQMIFKEIADFYNGKELKDLEVSFRDYINFNKSLQDSRQYEIDKKYWNDKLPDIASAPQLPIKCRLSDIDKPHFNRKEKVISKACWNQIVEKCKDHNIRPTFMLVTAYSLILSKWSNQKNLSINTTIFNRESVHKDIHEVVGDFTSLLLLDMKIEKNMTFWELALSVQENFMEAYNHKNYDGVNVIRDYCIYNKIDNKSAVMPIVFTSMLYDEDFWNYGNLGDVAYSVSQTSQVYLDYQVMQVKKGVQINWDYVTQVFEKDTIDSMFSDYISLIEGLLDDNFVIGKDKLLEKFVENYNDTDQVIETDTLQNMFKKQVELVPDNIAVKFKNEEITYKELDEKSNKISAFLHEKGVKKGDCVGVLAERKIESIINILGILKMGAAYVPINPDFPDERRSYILDNAECRVMLDSINCIENINKYEENLDNVYDNKNSLAYIIYTSGSTGKPKGVKINHNAVTNTIKDMNNRFNVNSEDVFIGLASIGFDLSVYDIFGSLSSGAELVLVEDQRNVEDVNNIIKNEKVTIWNSVPAVMEMLMSYRINNNDDDTQVFNYDDIEELRLVLLSGDWIPVTLPEKIKEEFMDCEVISLGGATEASIWSIYYPIDKVNEDLCSIPYGYPLANQKYYVLNYNKELCPIGVKGELYIGGVGLAEGYVKDEQKTKEAFIDHETYGRIYKTGDMGVMRKEGYIEFLGREDSQVKVRGYRVELGEIESEILEDNNIKNTVVLNGEDSNGISTLYGFFVSDEKIDVEKLRKRIAVNLPKYMIPTYIKQIDEIPLTANGKVDRKTLLSMEFTENDTYSKSIVEAKTDTEKRLVTIWKELLGIDEVSIEDNFFELGGNSILIIRLVVLIEKEFGIKINFKSFVENSQIKKMASIIDKSDKVQLEEIEYKEITSDVENQFEEFDLTNIQIAYLIGRNKEFELGGTSTHYYLEIETGLDIDKLNECLLKVINRHPMLRAVFLDNMKQKVLDKVPDYKIKLTDISNLNSEGQNEYILKEREKMSHHVFDPAKWPLFDFKALKVDDKNHLILFGIDLLISDGASIQMIFKEMSEFYKGIEKKPLEITFRDYINAQKDITSRKQYKVDEEYWNKKLADIPPAPQLPLKDRLDNIKDPTFGRKAAIINNDIWDKISKIAASKEITPAIVLFTAYAKILSNWSNQENISINTTVFNRQPIHKDVNSIIGDFTSLILLDVDLSNETNFWNLAKRVQKNFMDALEHRSYDGVNVIRDYCKYNEIETGSAVMPIVFTSMLFGKTLDLSNSISSIGEVKMSVSQTSQVYLDHQVMEVKDGVQLSWDYINELFEQDTINEMFKEYFDLITGLVGDKPGIIVNEDLNNLINKYNNTDENIEAETLQKLFMDTAKKNADNIAVKLNDEFFTYEELDKRSNKIANYLIENKIGRKDYIGIYAKRDIRTIANILGVLKSGAAYVPLEPEYPEERREYILSNSNCNMLLNPEFYDENNIDKYSEEFLGIDDNVDDVAYVIYTSGSTGRPKGVVIKHKSASNTILDINNKYNVTNKDRIIALSSMGFDLSVYDIFGALTSGAALVMIQDHRDVMNLINVITSENITIWNSVPAIMNMVISNLDEDYINNNLRAVLLSGDYIPLNLPDNIRKHFNNADVISLGGATEGSIWSIYYPIKEVKKEWSTIPYGMPLANQKIYILNYNKEICPVDVQGEIYIGGIGVAEGYMNEEEKTKNAFIHHETLGYIYKTGDYGILRKEGYVEFVGRKDYQVKIRGYRIELGEIEKRILEYKHIKNVVVVDKVDMGGNKYLCAYFQAEEEVNINEMSDYLIKVLPEYMVPGKMMQIDEIPLTQNGKVDLKSLPEFEVEEEVAADIVDTPTNEIEEAMLSVWREIFGTNRIGIKDRFFSLGGDSIKAIQICAKLQRYGYRLAVHDILLNQSIDKISKQIKVAAGKFDQGLVSGSSELVPIQKWFFEHNFKNMNQWNQGYIVYRKEGFSDKLLIKVMDKLVEHHDSLRSRFKNIDGEIKQYYAGLDEKSYTFNIYDLSEENNYRFAMNNIIDKLQESLDIENGPMMSLGLFKTIDGDYLMMTSHHLVVDGVSWRIIFEDLDTAYRQAVSGEEIKLDEKNYSFKCWSEELYKYAEGTKILEKAEYWKEIIKEESKKLPRDHEVSENLLKDSKTIIVDFSEEETDKLLQNCSRAYNSEINAIFLTALGTALKKWTGNNSFSINIEGHGREDIIEGADISRVIGWFTSNYPVIIQVDENNNIEQAVKGINKSLSKIPNKGIDYGILKYLTPKENIKDLEFNINPEITFNYLGEIEQKQDDGIFEVLPDFIESSMCLDSERASYIDVFGVKMNGKLVFRFIYNFKAFNEVTIENLSNDFKNQLVNIIEYSENADGLDEANEIEQILEDSEISIEEFDDIVDILNE